MVPSPTSVAEEATSQHAAIPEPKSEPKSALDISDLTDGDTCTVLYNYGVVAPNTRTFLGGVNGLVAFRGGVARDVPFQTARMWRDGKRLDVAFDGSERIVPVPGGPITVHILRRNATEADFAAAINPDALKTDAATPARIAANMRGMSAGAIIELLGEEDATFLAEALCDALGIRTSTAFSDGKPNPLTPSAARSSRRK